MSWSLDQNLIKEFLNNSQSSDWTEWKALSHYSKIKKQFPKEHQDLRRLGSFQVMEFTGTEGLQCCLSPLEGHPKILGSHNQIKLFDKNAKLHFEGKWSQVPLELIKTDAEFYLWLEHKTDAHTRSKPNINARMVGAWRFLRHQLKK